MKEFNPGDKVKIRSGEHDGRTGVVVRQRETPGVVTRPVPESGTLPQPTPETVYDVRLDDQSVVHGLRPGALDLVDGDQANS